MRNLLKIVISFVMLLDVYNITNNKSLAYSQTSSYAKVLSDCVLYKEPNFEHSIDNIYFTIPETYFVTLLEEISENCFKVQYGRFVGYVKSNCIIKATFIPNVKTLEKVTFDIKSTSGTQIWSKPSSNSKVLTTISAGVKNVSYIASTYGMIPIGGESNLWYYVSYTPLYNSTNVYEGYVYSENVTNLSNIVANTECNPELISNDKIADNVIFVSSSVKTVLVVLISIPLILFILIIMYKIIKKVTKNTNKDKIINTENASSYNNYSHDFKKENSPELKNELNKMKGVSFIKKSPKLINDKSYPYPDFPSYDIDDDML